MRLAITGATGFVGSTTLDAALAAGHSAKALTRRDQPLRDGIEWVRGTLSDAEALAQLCDGTDAVIHIAGLTNTPDPAEFEAVNTGGTQAIMDAATAVNARRFVFVSSLSAREPQLSDYGTSKSKAEALVEASSLDWTIVRPPAVYGPRETEMFELFRSAKWGLVPLPPGGATSVIHAGDLASLLIALAEHSGLKTIYEPDDNREGGWAHKELAQAIGRAVGKRSVLAPSLPKGLLNLGAGLDRLVRGDRAKLTNDRVSYMSHPNWVVRSDRRPPSQLWQPQIDVETGLKATADWYKSEGWL